MVLGDAASSHTKMFNSVDSPVRLDCRCFLVHRLEACSEEWPNGLSYPIETLFGALGNRPLEPHAETTSYIVGQSVGGTLD